MIVLTKVREKLVYTRQSFETLRFKVTAHRRGHSSGKKFQTLAIFNIIPGNYILEESLLTINLGYSENMI